MWWRYVSRDKKQKTGSTSSDLTPDVHRWFREAYRRGTVPTPEHLGEFTAWLNSWPAPASVWRKAQPSDLKKFLEAVRSLQRALPPMIKISEDMLAEETELASSMNDASSARPCPVNRLAMDTDRLQKLVALRAALSEQPFPTDRLDGSPSWYNLAEPAGAYVYRALRKAGRKTVDFKTKSSPAIKVVKMALEHLRCAQEEGAIVYCLGERSQTPIH
jgi:hypothetical protein